MDNSCNLNIAYPEITVSEKNTGYAKILLPAIGSKTSELTAITTYTFQSIITKDKDAKISQIIECISITEMKHYEILSELILKLGGVPLPLTVNNRGKVFYWNSSFINSQSQITNLLNENIRAETNAISDYKSIINRINDENIAAIIERIIKDEEHHIEIFKALLDKCI